MSDEILLTGRMYYTESKRRRYGVSVVTRSELGQGWGMDLDNITPNDLRVLADFIEERIKEENK